MLDGERPSTSPAGAAGSSKRAQNKLENRRAILTAAREVFAEVGYEAASVRDIIGRTGLASGTFYNYYRSKEEIAHAMASDAAERLRPILRAHREGANDFAGYLIGIIRVYFQFIVDEQLALRTTRQLAERYPRVRIQTPAAAAVPPLRTSTLGCTSAMRRNTKGRQEAISVAVGVRLPGGRQ